MMAHRLKKYSKAIVRVIPFFLLSFAVMGLLGAGFSFFVGGTDGILDSIWFMQYAFGFPAVLGAFYEFVGEDNSVNTGWYLGVGIYYAAAWIGGKLFDVWGIVGGIAICMCAVDLYIERELRKREIRDYVEEVAKENNIQMFYTDRMKTKEDVRNLAYQIKNNIDRK